MKPTLPLTRLLFEAWAASLKRAGIAKGLDPHYFDQVIARASGPYFGRHCLRQRGSGRVCQTTRVLVARHGGTRWAYGWIWDTNTGYTNAAVLWVKRVRAPWDVAADNWECGRPLPAAVRAAWRLKNCSPNA